VYSPDGNQFYVAGYNGVDYFASFTPSAALQSPTATITSTTYTVVGLQGDGANLYALGGSGSDVTVGLFGGGGFPTMAALLANIPGFPGSGSNPAFPVDAYFTHLDGPGAPAGVNTVYISDDGTGFTRGTITKWSFDGASWSLTDTIQADGTTVVTFYWLAGQTDPGSNTVTLYSTYGQGGNSNTGRGDLYQLTDAGGWNQPFSSPTVTSIATVSDTSLENFRGVAFAPVGPFGGDTPGAPPARVPALVPATTSTDARSSAALVGGATTPVLGGGSEVDAFWRLLGARGRRGASLWSFDEGTLGG
jgi:hypothetical protein